MVVGRKGGASSVLDGKVRQQLTSADFIESKKVVVVVQAWELTGLDFDYAMIERINVKENCFRLLLDGEDQSTQVNVRRKPGRTVRSLIFI